MRVHRLVPLGLAAGAAAWAIRESVHIANGAARPAGALALTTLRHVGLLPPRTQAISASTQQGGAASRPAASLAPDAADGADVTAIVHDDPELLVTVERELLTVPGKPGETHRRRDQTSGLAARELAAAQVRQRRNGA